MPLHLRLHLRLRLPLLPLHSRANHARIPIIATPVTTAILAVILGEVAVNEDGEREINPNNSKTVSSSNNTRHSKEDEDPRLQDRNLVRIMPMPMPIPQLLHLPLLDNIQNHHHQPQPQPQLQRQEPQRVISRVHRWNHGPLR